jgi:glycosyltransferase involved in cell wall biosynthesis
MRVVLLGNFPMDTNQIKGGVQAAYAYLVKGLGKIDNLELHLITFRPPGWVGAAPNEQNGVAFHFLPKLPRFERFNNYRTYKSVLSRNLAQIRPDIIHAQEAGADAYVALQLDYPIVITVHGIRREDRKYYRSWNQLIRIFFDSVLIERAVLHKSRHLIAISHYVGEYFKPLLRPEAKVYPIPNAVDEHFFKLADNVKSQTVLYAGRVTPLKRVMDLVKAFASVVAQVPSAQLHIAGECKTDASYSASIHKWIEQNGLGNHIHMLGELKQDAILREFEQCGVFILSSAQENAPIVIAQAMAAGKPIVATRVGGVGEMVGLNGERGLLVCVGDINGLSDAMVHLLRTPSLMSEMGDKGRAFAWENYHQDRVAQRTRDVYQKIVTGEPSAHV